MASTLVNQTLTSLTDTALVELRNRVRVELDSRAVTVTLASPDIVETYQGIVSAMLSKWFGVPPPTLEPVAANSWALRWTQRCGLDLSHPAVVAFVAQLESGQPKPLSYNYCRTQTVRLQPGQTWAANLEDFLEGYVYNFRVVDGEFRGVPKADPKQVRLAVEEAYQQVLRKRAAEEERARREREEDEAEERELRESKALGEEAFARVVAKWEANAAKRLSARVDE